MPNICARYGLKDVDELLNKLNEPSEAQSIVNVLRNNNKATPDARTIQQMYYRKRLVRAGIVQNILSAIQEQLRKNGEIGFDELLRLQDHTLEFNCRVLKLGSTIDEGEQKRLDPENGIIANVARHVGCDEIIISNMSQGHQCLVPEDFAVSVCKATMMACQLSEPLVSVR